MGPRADYQPARHPAFAHRDVVVECPLLEHVVPASDIQARYGHLVMVAGHSTFLGSCGVLQCALDADVG